MLREDERNKKPRKFETLTAAAKLAAHTYNLCGNKNVFTPDGDKLTDKITDLADSITHNIRAANDIKLTKENLQNRRELQNEALDMCGRLKTEIQVAKYRFHLRMKKVEYWDSMIEEVEKKVKKWKESDARRIDEEEIQSRSLHTGGGY